LHQPGDVEALGQHRRGDQPTIGDEVVLVEADRHGREIVPCSHLVDALRLGTRDVFRHRHHPRSEGICRGGDPALNDRYAVDPGLGVLDGCPGIRLHYHQTPLYNSLFRGDGHMFVTPHLYGTPGYGAPLLHLRRKGGGGIFDRFATHFEAVWSTSTEARSVARSV